MRKSVLLLDAFCLIPVPETWIGNPNADLMLTNQIAPNVVTFSDLPPWLQSSLGAVAKGGAAVCVKRIVIMLEPCSES
jgi:hypothetical protein